MRRRLGGVLLAALGGTMVHAGCRAIEGLDGLSFETPPAPDAGDAAQVDDAPGDGGDDAPDDRSGATDAPDDRAAPDAPGDSADAADAPADSADAPDVPADDACAPGSYECGGSLPAGWAGPIALYEGAPGTVPECPTDYPVVLATGQSGVSAPPDTCGACTCSTPTATCSLGPLDTFMEFSCGGQPTAMLMLTDGACAPQQSSADFYSQADPQAQLGSCTPSGGGVTDTPPLEWTTAGIACGVNGESATCDGGLCAPQPAAPFDSQWCVWKMGASSCPSGFPTQHVWEQASDSRDCTPCACGGPAPATCIMTTDFYSDVSCNDSLSSLSQANTCHHQNGVRSLRATGSFADPPACPASGGSPAGSVVGTPAVTICCLP